MGRELAGQTSIEDLLGEISPGCRAGEQYRDAFHEVMAVLDPVATRGVRTPLLDEKPGAIDTDEMDLDDADTP